MSNNRSGCTIGEKCFCGQDAYHKVSDVILSDDVHTNRMELTSYLCCDHYCQIMGVVAKQSCKSQNHPVYGYNLHSEKLVDVVAYIDFIQYDFKDEPLGEEVRNHIYSEISIFTNRRKIRLPDLLRYLYTLKDKVSSKFLTALYENIYRNIF